MTKRDVAIWFCKVVALSEMISAAFHSLSGLVGWKFFGADNLFRGILALGFYGFVWLFTRGIGTEIAAEGEHGEPITSSAELGVLLLRCAGFSLFLTGTIGFTVLALPLAYIYFSSQGMPPYVSNFWSAIISSFLQATLGFFLAFGPRLRAALQSK